MAIKSFNGFIKGDDTYKCRDDRANNLGTASTKNSTSVVTDSSDLVESGAVKDAIPQVVSDAVGWDIGDLLKLTLADLKSINTAGTWNNNKYTYNGIEYTVNDDMTITTSGTASSNSTFYYFRNKTSSDYPSSMVLSGCPSGGSDSSFFQMVQLQGNPYTVIARDTGNGVNIEIPSDENSYQCLIRVSGGVTCNKTFIPKLVHISVDEQKADNSVIGTVEDGATASQAYAVGSHLIRDGAFKEVTQPIASGEEINSGNTTDKPIADLLYRKVVNLNAVSSNINFNVTRGLQFGNLYFYKFAGNTTSAISAGDIIVSSIADMNFGISDGCPTFLIYDKTNNVYYHAVPQSTGNVISIKALDAIPSGVNLRFAFVTANI